jgi:preprotein translocase subunit SecA
MRFLKWPEDEPLLGKRLTRAIESAQKQVEAVNFERRMNVLKYDEVMNTQRQVIYEERRKILEGRDLRDDALEMVQEVLEGTVAQFVSPEVFPEEWDLEALRAALTNVYPTQLRVRDFEEIQDAAELRERAVEEGLALYAQKEEELGAETMRDLERMVLLSIIDNMWREHLCEMDHLVSMASVLAIGGRDPLTEYRREAFQMFEEMKGGITDEFVKYIYRVELVRQDEPSRPRPQRALTSHEDEDHAEDGQQKRSYGVGRNAPCPCGSGRKYKVCHGSETVIDDH